MNLISKIFTIFLVCIVLTSCKMLKPQLSTVTVEKKQDVVVASDNLKTFLASHPKLSVVLRTPPMVTKDITQAQETSKEQAKEQAWLNKVYDALEQELILNGFDVKDRALVNNVLSNINTTATDQKTGDVFDYAKIGKILNVDLFIEITTAPKFLYEFPPNYKIKESGSYYEAKGALSVIYIEFAYRLVIAETGSVGGMLKLYHQTCLDGCDFYVLHQKSEPAKFQEIKYAGSNLFASKITFGFATTEDKVAIFFANQLINSLKQNK